MKTTPTQYAKALLAATEGKQQHEADAVIARFADRLRRDGQLKRLPVIIGAFSALWNKAHGITDVEVVSRERLDELALVSVERFVEKRYGAKRVAIVNRIDRTIKGGIVIRVGDEVFDGSVATQLKQLKQTLTGNGISHA